MEAIEELCVDSRIQLPNHAVFVGMSMSGKTRLLLHLLSQVQRFNPKPCRVFFYFDQYQDSYGECQRGLEAEGVQLFLRQGADVKLDDFDKTDEQTLVIIDDATEETCSSHHVAKITTNGRHKNLSLWLIWHSLYSKHPASRLITQNLSYLFFLPSVRLTSQLHTLDTQLRMKGKLVSAYRAATEAPGREEEHRYLLLDLSPRAHPRLRLRSHIHKDAQVVYL